MIFRLPWVQRDKRFDKLQMWSCLVCEKITIRQFLTVKFCWKNIKIWAKYHKFLKNCR